MVSNISAIFLWRMRVVERDIFMDAHTFGIKMGSIRNTFCQTARNAKWLLGMRVKRDVPQASLSFFLYNPEKNILKFFIDLSKTYRTLLAQRHRLH